MEYYSAPNDYRNYLAHGGRKPSNWSDKTGMVYDRHFGKSGVTNQVNVLRNIFQAAGYNYSDRPLLRNYAVTKANINECKNFIERNFPEGANRTAALIAMNDLIYSDSWGRSSLIPRSSYK